MIYLSIEWWYFLFITCSMRLWDFFCFLLDRFCRAHCVNRRRNGQWKVKRWLGDLGSFRVRRVASKSEYLCVHGNLIVAGAGTYFSYWAIRTFRQNAYNEITRIWMRLAWVAEQNAKFSRSLNWVNRNERSISLYLFVSHAHCVRCM